MRHPEVIAAVLLAVVLAVAWLAAAANERRRRGVQSRLAAVMVNAPQARSEAGLVTPQLRRTSTLAGASRGWLVPSRLRQSLAIELAATGDRVSAMQLAVVGVVVALLGGGVCLLVLRWPAIIAVLLGVGGGFVAAAGFLRSAQQRFQRRFVDLFPEALDVIVRAVRAGLPVLDAMEAATGTIGEPIAGEFGRLLDELRIGIDLEAALEHATERIRVADFRFFCATLILQRRTGGSLAETLANLAALIRRRKEVRLKARALSAESRATAYVIGTLPFLLAAVMFFVNPGLISLLVTDHRGKIMLGIAVVFFITGFAMMRSMIKRAAQ